jgi:hypothetical protein
MLAQAGLVSTGTGWHTRLILAREGFQLARPGHGIAGGTDAATFRWATPTGPTRTRELP